LPGEQNFSAAKISKNTGRIDGVSRTFNSTAIGVQAVQDNIPAVVVTGKAATSEDADGFVLMIARTDGDIIAKAYTDKESNIMLLASYLEASSEIAYQAGTDLQAEATAYDIAIANPLKIVVTSINETSIKGEFNGDLYPDGELDGDKITVTKGSFYVPLIKP